MKKKSGSEIIDETFNRQGNRIATLNNKIKEFLYLDKISISSIQKIFGFGYARSARLFDVLIDAKYLIQIESKNCKEIHIDRRETLPKFLLNYLIEQDKQLKIQKEDCSDNADGLLFYNKTNHGKISNDDLILKINGYHRNGESNGFGGVFSYADFIYDVIDCVTQGESLKEYTENIDNILKQDINQLTILDIKYYFRAIDRSERFCDGAIARELDSGRFRQMFNRYLEIKDLI